MFCDRCGARVGAGQEFCHACGKRLLLPSRVADTSMAGHFRTLGILWLVFSAFRLIPGGAFFFLGHFMPWYDSFRFHVPFFAPGVLLAVLGFAAGYGLLERRPWARPLAIVLAVLALFHLPVGTALGIYTLWALASHRGEQEYRATAS